MARAALATTVASARTDSALMVVSGRRRIVPQKEKKRKLGCVPETRTHASVDEAKRARASRGRKQSVPRTPDTACKSDPFRLLVKLLVKKSCINFNKELNNY